MLAFNILWPQNFQLKKIISAFIFFKINFEKIEE